jgi:hypothetical protein
MFPYCAEAWSAKSSNFSWIILGIRTSCNKKRNLYLRTKKEENPSLNDYYNKYSKILNKVIVAAKKWHTRII